MTISYCLPCHMRTADLERALPYMIAAADAATDVEIVIVDYGNAPPLRIRTPPYGHVRVAVVRVERPHYHMSHARNVSIRAATGDYVVISSADICPQPDFFRVIRARLEETGAVWLRPDLTYVGVIVCRRDELIAAGGYDERIEFYGAEDKDLQARLLRRQANVASYDASAVLTMFRTLNADKVAHYRLPLTKTAMLEHGSAIYRENVAAGRLVANEGLAWGQ